MRLTRVCQRNNYPAVVTHAPDEWMQNADTGCIPVPCYCSQHLTVAAWFVSSAKHRTNESDQANRKTKLSIAHKRPPNSYKLSYCFTPVVDQHTYIYTARTRDYSIIFCYWIAVDLSDALDIGLPYIDHSHHNILINRLSSGFGIHGSVFNWFMSYLS